MIDSFPCLFAKRYGILVVACQLLEFAMSKEILRVSHLTTRLRIGDRVHKVVDDLSFSLYAGKTLAIVGESGCGKSLTALSLMRILPDPPALPPEGEIWFNERNLLALPEREMRCIRGRNLSIIFQDPTSALNPVYPIGVQLAEMADLHLHLYGDEAEARCIQALSEVGIPRAKERLQDYPHQLSGGMRQRVMIAMALMCEPEVLIADEPTTALDVTVQAQVLDLLRQLQRERGMALLLITHDLGVVAEMADDVVVMYASWNVEHGTVREIFHQPGHPYTQGLFASRPTIESKKGALNPIKGSVPALGNFPKGCHFHPRCPYAMPICLKGTVPEFGCGGLDHKAKCWLHSEEVKQAK